MVVCNFNILDTLGKITSLHYNGWFEHPIPRTLAILQNTATTYLHDTLDVSMTLSEVDSPQFGCALPVLGMCLEDTTRSLTLGSDDATHFLSARNM